MRAFSRRDTLRLAAGGFSAAYSRLSSGAAALVLPQVYRGAAAEPVTAGTQPRISRVGNSTSLTADQVADKTRQALAQLAADLWDAQVRADPTLGAASGEDRFPDRLPNIGPDGRSAAATALGDILRRSDQLNPNGLADDDWTTYRMIRHVAQDGLLGLALGVDQLALYPVLGPHLLIQDVVSWQRLDIPGGVDALVSRFQAFPQFIVDYMGNLRRGLAAGRPSYVGVVQRVVEQIEALVAVPPRDSPFVPMDRVSADEAVRLVAVIESVVYPAYRRLGEFLRSEYLPRARTAPGLSTIRGGDDLYAYFVRTETTTDLRADELHRIGLEEIAAIEDEVVAIGARLGFGGGLVEIVNQVSASPDDHIVDSDALIARVEELIGRATAALPAAFAVLPNSPLVVRPIPTFAEQAAPPAYYDPPPVDGSRPGTLYVNTFQPATRPIHQLPAVVAHEAVPGHHLQLSLAAEQTMLPSFRHASQGNNGFVEGWALYCERLAEELGLYRSDRERIGMLQLQAWRAARLVVDTGIHRFGWDRDRAIAFFDAHVGLDRGQTAAEIDRYIALPAQALSYKTGQRVIEQLRVRAFGALGDRFELREFHREILRHGSVPLAILEAATSRWIDFQLTGA